MIFPQPAGQNEYNSFLKVNKTLNKKKYHFHSWSFLAPFDPFYLKNHNCSVKSCFLNFGNWHLFQWPTKMNNEKKKPFIFWILALFGLFWLLQKDLKYKKTYFLENHPMNISTKGLGAIRAKIGPTLDVDKISSKMYSQYVLFRNKYSYLICVSNSSQRIDKFR
jgi:hypothetical protein